MEFLVGFIQFWFERQDVILLRFWEHISLSFIVVVLTSVVAIPIGIIIAPYKKIANVIIGIIGVLYTIPSLALLAFMVPFFGIGKVPAIVAIFIYGLLPLVRNTYVGITEVDAAIIEAAKGMGSTRLQLLFSIQLPLALPVIIAGLRTMAVMTIAVTALAAYIGAGGLGTFIMRGLLTVNNVMILWGTIPVAILAIAADYSLGLLERKVVYWQGR